MTGFIVVIPARFASTRLPGKALREINGKPMLQHVYERGIESDASRVIVATDDERIANAAGKFDAPVCMTDDRHQSGTERIAEVADLMAWDDSTIVVNLQGDEPGMPAELINQCAALLDDPAVQIATLASPIQSREDFENPNVVKVVLNDKRDAIYFSRATIPYPRSENAIQTALDSALHHHGIYAYRCGVLRQLVNATPSTLELAEKLEQLRALSMSMIIRVGIPSVRPERGIDTEEDLFSLSAKK